MTRPALHLVVDPDDDVRHDRFLRSLHAPAEGRLVVHASSETTEHTELTWDVLRALGKRPTQTGVVRNERELWAWLTAWLVATGIRTLFVSRAHLISRRRWEQLAGLAAETGADLWLFVQGRPLTRPQRQVLKEWHVDEHDFADFRRLFQATAAAARTTRRPAKVPFPDVPFSDFTLFRATCRRQLSKRDFTRVDKEFTQTLKAMLRWAKRREARDDEAVAAQLQSLLRDASLSRGLTRLRAAQAAFYRRGIHVVIDVGRLAACDAAEHRPEVTDEVANGLRVYAHPRYATAAALSLTTALAAVDLAELDVGDLAADGATVACGDEVFVIPEPARDLIRVQRLVRLMGGAVDEDALFLVEARETSPEGRRLVRMHARGMNRLLKTAATETGVFSVSHWMPSLAESVRRNLARRGIRIMWMA